jgi:hypothetical protein
VDKRWTENAQGFSIIELGLCMQEATRLCSGLSGCLSCPPTNTKLGEKWKNGEDNNAEDWLISQTSRYQVNAKYEELEATQGKHLPRRVHQLKANTTQPLKTELGRQNAIVSGK